MTERVRFSKRYETRRPAEGLIYDRIPQRVQDGLLNLLNRLNANTLRLNVRLHHALDRKVPADEFLAAGVHSLDDLFPSLEWYEFCDACEEIYQALRPELVAQFSNDLSALFGRHYFGYEMRDGRIERIGARTQEQAIAKARGILRDPVLAGPDEQFQRAMGFFNRRPTPDLENCVREAVLAVEGVAQVLLDNRKLTLSDALKSLKKEKDVHPTLISLLEKLYAYRGDAEGVGHALTGEKEVRIEDAEFALGLSASAVVYLARLYGRAVE